MLMGQYRKRPKQEWARAIQKLCCLPTGNLEANISGADKRTVAEAIDVISDPPDPKLFNAASVSVMQIITDTYERYKAGFLAPLTEIYE